MALGRSIRLLVCVVVGCSGITPVALSQEAPAVAPPSVGRRAVSAVLARYKVDPSILVPKIGKPLPLDGVWSVGKETPAQCPKTIDPCVQVIYRVADTETSCEWIVLLRGSESNNFILSENEDVGRYFMTKVLDSQFQIPTLSKEPPIYPPDARRNYIQGSVKMMVHIAATGHVEQVTVISGPEALRNSALTAIRQWVYKPLVVDSTAIPFQTIAVINYRFSN